MCPIPGKNFAHADRHPAQAETPSGKARRLSDVLGGNVRVEHEVLQIKQCFNCSVKTNAIVFNTHRMRMVAGRTCCTKSRSKKLEKIFKKVLTTENQLLTFR